ncbi:MAG: hypothetical protein WDO14_20305 [Bacteroidota bacterium]
MDPKSDFISKQALLMSWIKHHKTRSIDQIRMACQSLISIDNAEVKYPLLNIFYPLLRKGLVEFSGNGNYFIPAPSILYYTKSGRAVGINLDASQKLNLIETYNVDEDVFGIVRGAFKKVEVLQFCNKNRCNFYQPKIPGILSSFPSIEQTVHSFQRSTPNSVKGQWYDSSNRQWTNHALDICPFRTDENAQRIYLKVKGDFYEIPFNNINPDGRSLAECYQAICSNRQLLSYNRETSQLEVSNTTIPIILERVLRMASLDQIDGVVENKYQTIFAGVSPAAMKEVNRIFNLDETHEQSN